MLTFLVEGLYAFEFTFIILFTSGYSVSAKRSKCIDQNSAVRVRIGESLLYLCLNNALGKKGLRKNA